MFGVLALIPATLLFLSVGCTNKPKERDREDEDGPVVKGKKKGGPKVLEELTAPTDGSTVGATFTLAVTSGTDPDVGDTLTTYYRTTLNGGTPSAWTLISGSASIGPFAAGTLVIEAKTYDGTVFGPTDSVTVTVVGAPSGPSVKPSKGALPLVPENEAIVVTVPFVVNR